MKEELELLLFRQREQIGVLTYEAQLSHMVELKLGIVWSTWLFHHLLHTTVHCICAQLLLFVALGFVRLGKFSVHCEPLLCSHFQESTYEFVLSSCILLWNIQYPAASVSSCLLLKSDLFPSGPLSPANPTEQSCP